MKLLRVAFDRLAMFKDGQLELDLYAEDKVFPEDESVRELERPIYTNNLVALAGVNASGKSVSLSLLNLACQLLGAQELEASTPSLRAPIGQGTRADLLFWDAGSLYVLQTWLDSQPSGRRSAVSPGITEQVLYRIDPPRMTKKLLGLPFDELVGLGCEELRRSSLPAMTRKGLGQAQTMMAVRDAQCPGFANVGSSDLPLELTGEFDGLDTVLRAFDSNIKHLSVEDEGRAYRLELLSREEPLVLSREGLQEVLSSGTLKGLSMVTRAMGVLNEGGYLFVDEVENHLNKQLVSVVLELFSSRQTNPYGATLVFTTHYPELLDLIPRKDAVYFLARDREGQSHPIKLNTQGVRADVKKSDVFLSNFVRGTAPLYTDIVALRLYAQQAVAAGGAND